MKNAADRGVFDIQEIEVNKKGVQRPFYTQPLKAKKVSESMPAVTRPMAVS
jgi:hypothetical protein